MTDNEKRGKFLAELRLKKDLKQSDLAKLINYSDKSISKWERGLSFPSNHNVIYKLSKIYNVSIDEILRGEYDNSYKGEVEKSNVKKYFPSLYFNIILFIIFVIVLMLFLFNLNNNLSEENSDDFVCYLPKNIARLSKNFSSDNLSKYFINSVPYFYHKNKCDSFASKKIDTKNNAKSNDTSKVLKKSKTDANKKFNFKDYGFTYEKFVYKKVMNKNVDIYYFESYDLFRIFYKTNDRNLMLIYSISNSQNNIIDIYKNYVLINSFYSNITSLKNCDNEKCSNYKDYIMYLNYLKHVKNGM